jgi:hypothetical protein
MSTVKDRGIYAVISMFYGILILMFSFDNKKHHLPHIHAQYAEHAAIIAIDSGEVMDGDLPKVKNEAGSGMD